MEKPEEGQKAWLKLMHRRGNPLELIEVKIKSVGRKYFYIDGHYSKIKFDIETGFEVSDYNNVSRIYLDPQIFLDENETSILYNRIKSAFNSWSNKNISLEKLRQIDKVLTP